MKESCVTGEKNIPSPAVFLSSEEDLKNHTIVCLWVEMSVYESLWKLILLCGESSKATKHPSECLLSVFRTFSLCISKLRGWLPTKSDMAAPRQRFIHVCYVRFRATWRKLKFPNSLNYVSMHLDITFPQINVFGATDAKNHVMHQQKW